MGLLNLFSRNCPRPVRTSNVRAHALTISRPRSAKQPELATPSKKDSQLAPKRFQVSDKDENVLSGPEYQHFIEHELPNHIRVHVVILAGGAGHPDNPLARSTNTAEIPVGGNRRLIDVVIGACLLAGFVRMHVLTQQNSYHLHKYINTEYCMDQLQPYKEPAFVHTLACHQTPESKSFHRGSGDALRASMPHISKSIQGLPVLDYIVIASGQDLHDLDMREFVAFARAHKADLAVAVQQHQFQGAHKMGVMKVNNQSHRIEQFVERPSVQQLRRLLSPRGTLTVSLGMYVVKRTVLERILGADRGKRMAHVGGDIVPYAVGMGMNAVAYTHTGTFKKCTELATFFSACMDFAAALELPPEFRFMRDIQGRKAAHALPPAQCRNSTLTDTVLSEGVQLLGGTFNEVVVGQRMFIAPGANISRTVFYGLSQLQDAATYEREVEAQGHGRGVGRNVTLENVVVCADVSIGDDVSITNKAGVRSLDLEDQGIVVQDGIAVILQGAVIPNGFNL